MLDLYSFVLDDIGYKDGSLLAEIGESPDELFLILLCFNFLINHFWSAPFFSVREILLYCGGEFRAFESIFGL